MLQFFDLLFEFLLDTVVIFFHAQFPQGGNVPVTVFQTGKLFHRGAQRRQVLHDFLRSLRVFPQIMGLRHPLQAADLDLLLGYVKETP